MRSLTSNERGEPALTYESINMDRKSGIGGGNRMGIQLILGENRMSTGFHFEVMHNQRVSLLVCRILTVP